MQAVPLGASPIQEADALAAAWLPFQMTRLCRSYRQYGFMQLRFSTPALDLTLFSEYALASCLAGTPPCRI